MGFSFGIRKFFIGACIGAGCICTMPAPCYSDACMGLAWGLQMFGSQTINHATTAAQAGNRGAIGTLGANGREGDSPLVENLDTGFLNW